MIFDFSGFETISPIAKVAPAAVIETTTNLLQIADGDAPAPGTQRAIPSRAPYRFGKSDRTRNMVFRATPILSRAVARLGLHARFRRSQASHQEGRRLRFLRPSTARLAALSIAIVTAVPASAADFPSRAIHLVVPFAPGGPVDIVGRTVAEGLSRSLGQPVVVDNRGGGSAIIGTIFVAKAPADGYTLLLFSSINAIQPSLYSRLPYDPKRDFATIGIIGTAPFVLVAGPHVEATTVRELIAYIKANPNRTSYGTPGIGSPNHLSTALLKSMTGIDSVHVPYKGAAPAETDLIGGATLFMFDTIPSAMPMLGPGRLHGLAVTSSKRSPLLPNIPTMEESGMAGFNTQTWYGLMAPKGLPPEIIAKLNTALAKLLRDPQFAQRIGALGMQPSPGSPEEFARFLDQELVKWAQLVKTSGAHLDFDEAN